MKYLDKLKPRLTYIQKPFASLIYITTKNIFYVNSYITIQRRERFKGFYLLLMFYIIYLKIILHRCLIYLSICQLLRLLTLNLIFLYPFQIYKKVYLMFK